MTTILGHSKIISYLEKISKKKNDLPHAFLFSGSEGIGKKTVALKFAGSLVCQQNDPPFGGCGKCDACLAVASGTDPDIIYIDPKEIAERTQKSELITIEAIRNLKKNLSLNPYHESSVKVAVINDAHKMEKEGFNALLKTLEEPPARSVIILVSSLPESMPKTILSRVQSVKFSRPSKKEIKEYLEKEKIKAGEDDAEVFWSDLSLLFSGGGPAAKKRGKQIAEFRAFLDMPLEEKYDRIENILKKEDDLESEINGWVVSLRDILLEKISADARCKQELPDKPKGFAGSLSVADTVGLIKAAMELNFTVKTTNVNKKIALDNFILIFEENKK